MPLGSRPRASAARCRTTGTRRPARSPADHWPWVKRGVPGFITVGGPANSASPDSNEAMKGLVDYVTNKYHRPGDEYDAKTWRMDGIEGDVKILFEFSWRVAEDARMPNFRWSSPYRALSDARSP